MSYPYGYAQTHTWKTMRLRIKTADRVFWDGSDLQFWFRIKTKGRQKRVQLTLPHSKYDLSMKEFLDTKRLRALIKEEVQESYMDQLDYDLGPRAIGRVVLSHNYSEDDEDHIWPERLMVIAIKHNNWPSKRARR